MSTKKKKKGELVSLSFYTFTKKLKKKKLKKLVSEILLIAVKI